MQYFYALKQRTGQQVCVGLKRGPSNSLWFVYSGGNGGSREKCVERSTCNLRLHSPLHRPFQWSDLLQQGQSLSLSPHVAYMCILFLFLFQYGFNIMLRLVLVAIFRSFMIDFVFTCGNVKNPSRRAAQLAEFLFGFLCL